MTLLKTRIFVLGFCVALLASVPVYGQSGATLRGLVTSGADGSTLQSANVVLTGLESELRRAAVTDVEGYYEIRGIPPSRYLLTVSFVGFETHEDTLTVSAGRRNHNVTLAPKKQELREVQVEEKRGATRRDAGLQTIGTEDIERVPTPGPGGDLASYLKTQPGVVAGGSRGGTVNIRGGTSSQNLFLVDGLPVVKPFHISNLYSAFSEDLVKSVDFYAGGFGAEYLGGTSSVVDVTLREGNTEAYAGSASFSPFVSSMRVEGPLETGKQSFLVALRRSTVKETAGPLYGRTVPLTFYDFTGRYLVQSSGANCSITGMRTYDQGRLSNERSTSLSWSNTVLGGKCILFGEGLDQALEVSAGYSSFGNEAGTEKDPERSAGLEKGFFRVTSSQTFSWGAFRWGVNPEFVSYDFTIDQKFSRFASRSNTSFRLKAFTALPIEIGDYLILSPSFGMQLDGQSNSLEPRFRLAYRPNGTDRREVSLAVGRYGQLEEGITDTQDAGTEFTIWTPQRVGDGSQSALHAILGYRERVAENIEVNVEGYGKKIRNIPVPEWTVLNRFETRLAAADGTVYGLDARVGWSSESTYLFLGYGWSKVTYRARQKDLGAWIDGDVFEYSPSHDQRHQINSVIGVDIGQATLNLSWEFGSGRPYTKAYAFDLIPNVVARISPPTEFAGREAVLYDKPYGGRLPSYHRLDLTVKRPFEVSSSTSFEVEVGAINAYDRKNVFYYDVGQDNVVRQIPVYPYVSLGVRIN